MFSSASRTSSNVSHGRNGTPSLWQILTSSFLANTMSEYTAPYRFTGGTIDKVVVDVSGDKFVDHEAQVAAWFAND